MHNEPTLTWHSGKMWLLDEDWNFEALGSTITIPRGFVWDLASIPRIFWIVKGFAPMELSTAAPLLHDFLYVWEGLPPADSVNPYRAYSRSEADRLFRLIMKAEGVGRARRTLAWLAVRLGGYFSWRSVT